MLVLLKCLCAIALIQNDTPARKTTPLLDKRNPLINTIIKKNK